MNFYPLQPTHHNLHSQSGLPDSRQAGMSVIEIITVVGLSVILLVAFLRFIVVGYPISKITYLQVNSTETARLQLKRMARELRQLRYSDTGGYPLVETSPARIIFYANVDGDSATERVRYEVSGNNLVRGITNPSGNPLTYNVGSEQVVTIARSIHNDTTPVFTYYTGDYPAVSTPLTSSDVTEVKYIQFHLLIDVDTTQPPDAADVASQVQLRNLKTNLGEEVQ